MAGARIIVVEDESLIAVDWLEMEIELVGYREKAVDEPVPEIRFAIGEGLSGWIAEQPGPDQANALESVYQRSGCAGGQGARCIDAQNVGTRSAG